MNISLSMLSESRHLSSSDFIAGHKFPVLEIASIEMEEVIGHKGIKSQMAVMHFVGAKKGWAMNQTERRKICRIFGISENINLNWIGGKVKLCVAGDVKRKDGTIGNALRVDECWPPPAQKNQQPPTGQGTAP